MTIKLDGLSRQPGQGTSYWFDRDLYTFNAVGNGTGEAYALCEVIVAPSIGLKLCLHPLLKKREMK